MLFMSLNIFYIGGFKFSPEFKYIDMKNFNIGDGKRKFPYPVQVLYKVGF